MRPRDTAIARSTFLVAAGLACLLPTARGSAADPPNFIVFVADDMAWNDCGAYGHPTIRTPNIDRLADDGIRFDRAFLTCSSCSPSRSSILTSRYPHATGAGELHQPLPESQVLLSTPLREAGYYTAVAGKWHLGGKVRDQFDRIMEGGGPGGEQHWTAVLRERPKDRPFFLWLAAFDPHRDYQAGAFDPPHAPEDSIVPSYLPDTPAVRGDLAAYYDEIARFDSHIGKVLDVLEEEGLADDTFVLVMTDNGRPFPRCKTRINVDGVRTPWIIRYPGRVAPKSVSQALVSSIDLAPTILELAGVQAPPSFQGRSFADVLADPSRPGREFAFAEHNWHDYRAFERAVITPDMLLIRNWCPELEGTPPADAVRSPTYREMLRMRDAGQLNEAQSAIFRVPRPDVELYAWTTDPECLDDLAEDPARRDERRRLLEVLEVWQRDTDDVFPGFDSLTPDRYDRITGTRPESQ